MGFGRDYTSIGQTLIPVDRIIVDDPVRADHPAVKKLAESIAVVGLLHPIVIDRSNKLIAGRHRHAAVKLLGWEKVVVTVRNVEGDLAELARLDENLARADRTALELSELIAQRKEVYERLHPATKHGGDRKSDQAATVATRSFAADTAEKTGQSERKVQMYARVAKDLVPEAKAAIASTPSADSITDLDALAKLEPADQVRVAKHVAKAKQPTPVKRAVKELKRQAQDRLIKKYVAPDGLYEVILDDPSWQFRQTLKAMDRDLPYPPETMEKIKADVPPADKNCTLYLCSTNAHLRQAFEVAEAWGFRWTGAIVTWGKVDKKGKPRKGMGFWIRGCTEQVLICVKGKPLHKGANGDSLLLAERGANSEKPDELYELIEQLSPAKMKLERHSRKARPGWTTSGAELPRAAVDACGARSNGRETCARPRGHEGFHRSWAGEREAKPGDVWWPPHEAGFAPDAVRGPLPKRGRDFLAKQSAGRFFLTHAGLRAMQAAGRGDGMAHGRELYLSDNGTKYLLELAAAGAGKVPRSMAKKVERERSRLYERPTKRRTA